MSAGEGFETWWAKFGHGESFAAKNLAELAWREGHQTALRTTTFNPLCPTPGGCRLNGCRDLCKASA